MPTIDIDGINIAFDIVGDGRPPWGDREWLERLAASAEGPFVRWPLLAPQILEFTRQRPTTLRST